MTDQLVVLEQEGQDGRLAVRLRGEIDLANVERVQQRLDSCVEGRDHVVLDLTEVEYLDSQGLRLLSRLANRLSGAGVEARGGRPAGERRARTSST